MFGSLVVVLSDVTGFLVVILVVVAGSLVVVTSIGPKKSFSYVRYPNPIVSSVIITILPSRREKTYSAALPRTLFASGSNLRNFLNNENYKLVTDLTDTRNLSAGENVQKWTRVFLLFFSDASVRRV